MRRSTSFVGFFPFIVALILLSLPVAVNKKLQELGGNALASLSSFPQQKKPPSEEVMQLTSLKQWFQKNESERADIASFEEQKYPYLIGKVIFRSIHSWSSSVWIDVGADDNTDPEHPIACINSPVLSGDAVVGVIDYLGKKTSLVRLITDSGLTPAVRVARGSIEYTRILHSIDEIRKSALTVFDDTHKLPMLHLLLDELSTSLQHSKVTQFLAKGELQGHGEPFLRAPGRFLKGVGFHYDFPDIHGPARPLRPLEGEPALIQTQDLLVTSGLDGVFPEGLPIARVHSIAPLKEGAIAYDILAEPLAHDLYDLRYVSVIAPQKPIELSH